MNRKERMQVVFKCGREYLFGLVAKHKELTAGIVNKHLKDRSSVFTTLNSANNILISSSNRSMMKNVINFVEKEKSLKKILFGFNPHKIIRKYADEEELFEVFKRKYNIRNAKSRKCLWRVFAGGIISGSRFLAAFKNRKELSAFLKQFSFNKYTKAALPMLISEEVRGFGMPLACDFLRELGYDYPKPDVHLITIFSELGLSESDNYYDVYKALVEMAETVKTDALMVDRVFWLISSGNFFMDQINIGRNRNKFINFAKAELKLGTATNKRSNEKK